MTIDQMNEPIGLDALLAIDKLPVLKNSSSYLISSYNRNHWNDDNVPVYLEKHVLSEAEGDESEGTIAKIEGTGYISRVWLGGGGGARLKFYFDGENEARVSLRFSGPNGEPEPQKNGTVPLASGMEREIGYPPMMATGVKNGAHLETGICYMPMPFAKSCRIAIEPAMERKYFQVNYQLFPEGTPLKSFNPTSISQNDLQKIKRIVQMWYQAGETLKSSPDRSARTVSIKACPRVKRRDDNEAVLLDLKSTAGRVNAVRIKLPEAMRKEHILRSLILKVYWDGENRASIDAPVGPFFGDAFGTPSEDKPVPLSASMDANVPDEQERKKYAFGLPTEYKNFLIGYTKNRGYYAYFPMPFFSGAKFVLVNETGVPLENIGYEIEYETQNEPDQNVGRFHALYHRENPTLGIDDPNELKVDFTGRENFVILKSRGRGHYVGTSFFMVQKRRLPHDVEAKGVGGICEGNEMIFVDDRPELTLIGTGTEDYLNQNYWVHDHVYPFDGNRQGYRACYRLHVSDCVPFSKKVAVTIEHGAGNAHFLDYSSVAYWYQEAKPWVKSGSFGI